MSAMAKPLWAAMLAKMVAPMDAERAGKAIGSMIPMLTLPDQAFTLESLRAVAATGRVFNACEYGPLTRVPTFGELETALGRWWRAKTDLELLKKAPSPRERLAAPTAGPATPQGHEQVANLVQAFVSERSFNHSTATDERSKTKPNHLSDGQLADAYKSLGIRGPRVGP